MTLEDMAAAVQDAPGNTAPLWHGPPAEKTLVPGDQHVPFDDASRALLEEAAALAQREGAEHVGTEHLLAALVRTGPQDIVARLAERGATAESVDDLLAGLHGGIGIERPAAKPKPKMPRPVAIALLVLLVAVLFVFCVWGP
ncbi:Clp protease N-terminal domain-containing protein [Dactylosporangium darangshiense]